MSSESSLEMASQTVSDVSQISLGAERGAENLMRDVSNARADLGSNSRAFNDYDSMVSTSLDKNSTLPMLSLGHAKNSFDKLDLDGSGDLTKDELIIARDHAGSKVEERILAMLSTNFQDVRSAHESNKWIPFAEDKKGITLDDLDAKLKEGESNMDKQDARVEQDQRYAVMDEIGNDLLASRGASFSKLARGDKDGNHNEIEKSDLEELIGRDNRTKEFGADTLTPEERRAAEYMVKNWDSPEVDVMRKDVVTYPDATGQEQKDKGGITLSSLDKKMTGGIDFDALDGNIAQRLPDEDALAAKFLNRQSKDFDVADYAGTDKFLTDHSMEEFFPINKATRNLDGIHRPEAPTSLWNAEVGNAPEWKVQKGEYLWMIAEQSLVGNGNCKPSVREINDMTNLIAKENNMHRNDYLKVGQRLSIPQTQNGRR